MHLNAYLLTVLLPVSTNLVQCFPDLFNRLLTRYVLDETVGLDLHTGTAAVVHQLDVTLCQFNVRPQSV